MELVRKDETPGNGVSKVVILQDVKLTTSDLSRGCELIDSDDKPDIEYVSCNLCDADNHQLLFKASVLEHRRGQYAQDEWNIVKCRFCGLIYLNPRPGPNSLNNLYAFENPGDMAFVREWFIDNADIQRVTWQRILRAIQSYCPGGRLLDVGCGAGSFLVNASAAGFETIGQEVSPFFYRYGREQRGLNILLGELEELNLLPESFDCITAFDVIEHHPDPTRMLRTIRRLLKPGGFLVIGTHDIGNIFARIYGRRWRYIAPTGHLTYFNRRTLAAMIEQNGYSVIRQAGLHTVDKNKVREFLNALVQFFRLIILRGGILLMYKPLSQRFRWLAQWQFHWRGALINHEKVIRRAGRQIAMNDNLILFAQTEKVP